MHLAQELLTNIQSSGGSRSFAKETRPLKMRNVVVAIRSWQWPTERITEADPLITRWEVAEELSVDHSTVIQHLKQIVNVKKLHKWVPHVKVAQSCLTLCDSMDYTVHGVLQARTLEWVAFPFSRGSSQDQELNPGLPHCRRILDQLSHEGSPRILQWVAYRFSRGSSRPRKQNRVSCIAGRFFTNWSARETW